ncbi:hypothetical protein ACFTXJ_23925 [Streptomyces zhihengii]|uniref:hypothetical protein n=1 Tax=Streptomyces zhihengii TaxID=1818004 RepID=UPI00363B0715
MTDAMLTRCEETMREERTDFEAELKQFNAACLTVTPEAQRTPALRASGSRTAFIPALKGGALAKLRGRTAPPSGSSHPGTTRSPHPPAAPPRRPGRVGRRPFPRHPPGPAARRTFPAIPGSRPVRALEG